MSRVEIVRLYAQYFNVDTAYAEQSLVDMGDFMKYMASLGRSFELPGVMRLDFEPRAQRSLYDFQKGCQLETRTVMTPVFRSGADLRDAAQKHLEGGAL